MAGVKIVTKTVEETEALGQRLGKLLTGGELIELTGDLGSGKTVFIKGLAKGLGVDQPISSPTFTISRVYDAGTKQFHHFDFYRIGHKDIVGLEIAEAANDPDAVVAVEWAEHIKDALPKDHLSVNISSADESKREISLIAHDEKYQKLIEKLK